MPAVFDPPVAASSNPLAPATAAAAAAAAAFDPDETLCLLRDTFLTACETHLGFTPSGPPPGPAELADIWPGKLLYYEEYIRLVSNKYAMKNPTQPLAWLAYHQLLSAAADRRSRPAQERRVAPPGYDPRDALEELRTQFIHMCENVLDFHRARDVDFVKLTAEANITALRSFMPYMRMVANTSRWGDLSQPFAWNVYKQVKEQNWRI